jgi:hypothetical protein
MKPEQDMETEWGKAAPMETEWDKVMVTDTVVMADCGVKNLLWL